MRVTERRSDGSIIEYDTATTLNELKAEKLASLKANAAAALMLYKPTTGPLAGHVIQTGRIEDQVRLDQSLSIYRRKIEAGAIEAAKVEARFRTAANLDVLLSYTDGYAVLVDGVGGWGKRITHKAWDLTNLIITAIDQLTLDAIDIDTGWPTE